MRTALAGLLVLVLAATTHANGRDPYGVTINFRPGSEQQIYISTTFGLIVSNDGGATWQWICETAIGYAGMYDPDYAYSPSGALFATTFDGLKVMRDGCNFVATPPGMTFASKVDRGPDGAIYFAASDSTVGDSKVYKSTDDGMSFPTSATPGQAGDWWWSIAAAPSDATRIYLTGFRLEMGKTTEFLIFTSANGGSSFTAMPLTGITPLSSNAWLEIVGVDPANALNVFLRVKYENGTADHSIYKWNNAGQSWTKLITRTTNWDLSFLVRKNGAGCVAGTRDKDAAWVSQNCDANWVPLTNPPRIGCLFENSAGEVWACTQNYDVPEMNIVSDGAGIMKTTDLSTWTHVLKFQDIQAPVPCPAGTLQEDRCVQRFEDQAPGWCCLVDQLDITSTAIDCAGALKCAVGLVDSAGDVTVVKPPDGCCGTAPARSSALLALLVAAGLLRPRRRTKER